ncbi:unnamed protein product [Microthlaspi erraticum]|uniref:Uncharacterized protein n=1 Tax=Microthlaspi erraticum TaxID=1685480 RepID=A0A6D2JTE3_9BRAS|nr:unnamed protein product [Microthlaspi erraticum]
MMMRRRSPFCLDIFSFYSSPASACISPASIIFGISCCTCSGFSGISTEQLTPDFSGLRRTTLTVLNDTSYVRSSNLDFELSYNGISVVAGARSSGKVVPLPWKRLEVLTRYA